MKALLLSAPSRLEIVDFPDPQPADDEVLLRIRACGICGSDIHGWDGSSGRRQPPLIMGHEAAGEIVAHGSGVDGWKVGARVTFDSTISCGDCAFCQQGQVNLCENRRVVGVAPSEYRQHGAFAELLALPARLLHPLPETLSFEHAAMVEPVSVALHAVRRGSVAPEHTALVVGSGMIGLFIVQALRRAEVKRIIAVDLADNRLELARRLGATDTINAVHGDPSAGIRRLTGGTGVDRAFEVVGATVTVNLSLAALKRGGTAVLVGNLAPTTNDFPLQTVVTQELTVTGTCGIAGEYPAALESINRGTIDVRPMIETVAPLADGPDWFSRLSAKDGGRYMKVILVPPANDITGPQS
jgi:L-iditol 2-dehydrogenase